MAQTVQAHSEATGYELRREALSPVETLAQSVSTIAPTATPVATIPLVCALAGNGTWLAYGLATSAAILAARDAGGLEVYGWMGSLATYGFIVTYALASIALPRYLGKRGVFRPGAQIIPWLACLAMLLALVGNLYPVPEGTYGKLP